MNFMTFHILGMSSSQLTSIFFRGVGQPPTNYSIGILWDTHGLNYIVGFAESRHVEAHIFLGKSSKLGNLFGASGSANTVAYLLVNIQKTMENHHV